VKLQFLGAARQVTGSQYHLTADGVRVLVDCGMFQERAFLARNWEPSPIRPEKLDAVLVTHAHLDHCGLLPKLVAEGFRGPIYTTGASADLAGVLLRDSAKIQAEDAAFKRKRHRKERRKGKYPVRPLYTLKDVGRALRLLEPVDYDEPVALGDGVSAVFRDAGHILGSAMIELSADDGGRRRRLVFSGDVGQWDKPLVRDPSLFAEGDYVVMESTYGTREHGPLCDIESRLGEIVGRTLDRGGKVVVPIFAIERAQEVIYHLGRLVDAGRLPRVPVFLDSPMAVEVTEVFRRHRDLFDAEAQAMLANHNSPLGFPGLVMVGSTEESKGINSLTGPAVILATSGMCTAGRIKHHLVHTISDAENTILFVGYQAHGTLGRQILEGNPKIRIHGRLREVRAAVERIEGFSGHADRTALLRWLAGFRQPPEQLFLTHGEEESSLTLARQVRDELGWKVNVPEYREVVELV